MATQVEWRGAQVLDKLLKAMKDGIEETMGEGVLKAKRRPPNGTMPYLTGTLYDSIRFKPAEIRRNEVVGYWGSFDVNYAIYQETGTSRISGKYFLRNAADEEYPHLKGRIARRFKRGL